MRLQPITAKTPAGALALLKELGRGENGFDGTLVAESPEKFDEWLDYCAHLATAPPLSEDFGQQINYWIVNKKGLAIGLIRMQPRLNAALLDRGGHLGFYIAPSYRRQGHAKSALRLALGTLRKKGVDRALVTVDSHNTASLRLIEALGGIMEDERFDTESGRAYRRFWLKTKAGEV